MADRKRTQYRLALPAPAPPRRTGACAGLKLRRPAPRDVPLLGELLLDAYRGTIDDEGETLKRAIAEMQGYFDGKYGRALPEASAVAWRGPVPVSLSLVSWFAPTDCPFISYVATRSDSKGVGVGRLVLCESLRRLGRNGYGQVRAFITKGNAPSEALFKGRGFAPVANPP